MQLAKEKKFKEAENIYKNLLRYYKSLNEVKYNRILLALIQLYSKVQNYTESLPYIEDLLNYYKERDDLLIPRRMD